MNYYSHTTDESYREGTETLPYKIERSGTGAGVPPFTFAQQIYHCAKHNITAKQYHSSQANITA